MHPVDPVNPVKYHGLFYTTGQFNFYSTTQIETVTLSCSYKWFYKLPVRWNIQGKIDNGNLLTEQPADDMRQQYNFNTMKLELRE